MNDRYHDMVGLGTVSAEDRNQSQYQRSAGDEAEEGYDDRKIAVGGLRSVSGRAALLQRRAHRIEPRLQHICRGCQGRELFMCRLRRILHLDV